MDRRQFIAIGATTAFGGLAGCLSNESAPNQQSPESTSVITIQKTREVTASPDRASVVVGVELRGESVPDVRNSLTTTSENIRTALIDFGIAEENLTTIAFDIREDTRYRRDQEEPQPEEQRYIGRHALQVEVTHIDDVGPVIDTAVDAGANQIGRIEFTVSDETREQLREQALEQAIQAAEAEATVVANQTDTEISGVKRVDTSNGHVIPFRTDFESDAGDAAQAPPVRIDPSDVTVRASVTIEYRIQ